MLKYFKQTRKEIFLYLKEYLENESKEIENLNQWVKDGCKRLIDFVPQGKAIRGGLVVLSNEMLRKKENKDVIQLGAVMELFQSSLLIHDDIMDQDKIRRGGDSIYFQYTNMGKKLNLENYSRFGESMGICLGDLAMFYAYKLLAKSNIKPDVLKKIIFLFSEELIKVGYGQMQDIYFGHAKRKELREKIDIEDIIKLYIYKTSRYTFSLPMLVGAILGESNEEIMSTLSKLGEHLGIIFQIKDDEIDLFGEEKNIGKPIGSDIREGKITLLIKYILDKVDAPESKEIYKILLKGDKLNKKEINKIREIAKKSNAKKEVDNYIKKRITKAKRCLKVLSKSIERKYIKIFEELLNYSLIRKK